ncbi:MAG: radical SAM protein [Magnetococcales bacterium]|nr:radical SAM protein [Magnetococcales bacterium]
MIQKILLLFPPAYSFKLARDINPLPPMGLGYLASNAKKHGFDVSIFDSLLEGWNNEEETEKDNVVKIGSSDAEIAAVIREYKPDLIGVSCQFSRQYKIYPQIFALIKSIGQNIITLAGGAHVTVLPQDMLEDPNCDYIMQGEAEESFVAFLHALNNSTPLAEVDGLGWVDSDGKYNINQKNHWITDLDSLPFPDYDAMGLRRYFGLESSHGMRHEAEYTPVITSRGCPARCTFCSANKVWGWKYRARSIENVIVELRMLKDKYGIKEIMFEDDNVTANRKFAAGLFSRMIEEKFDFIWDTPNGVGIWTINEEVIDLMKASGCIKLNFPIESGDQRVLNDVIQKPLDLDHVARLISHCKKIDLDYGVFLVVGMPGETIKDIWTSFKYCASVGCYNPLVSIATPYPGTKLFDECIEKGYFSREFALDDLFTSSFMLKTPHWDEKSLRRTMLYGKIYLTLAPLLKKPWQVFSLIGRLLTRSKFIFSYVKKTIGSKA